MRFYRCPRCGKEGIYSRGGGYPSKYSDREVRVSRCSECHQSVTTHIIYRRQTIGSKIGTTIITFIIIVLIFLIFKVTLDEFLLLTYIFFCGLVAAAFIWIDILYFLGKLSPSGETVAYVMYDDHREKRIVLDNNATVFLDDISRIVDHGIYGVKFDVETKSEKYNEAFCDGLIPVIFYTGNAKYVDFITATIIKHEMVPEELLVEGASFSIIHNNKFITKGKIRTLKLENEE